MTNCHGGGPIFIVETRYGLSLFQKLGSVRPYLAFCSVSVSLMFVLKGGLVYKMMALFFEGVTM